MGRREGFTLIEVLVALAVVAIALAALVRAVGQGADTEAGLRERAVARWVALNRIAELELARAWPAPGRRDGTVRMAGRRWRWEERVLPTESPDLRRVELTVRPGDAPRGVRVRLVAFLGRPLRTPPADEGPP